MKKILFTDLSDDNRSQAIKQMLEINQLRHHPLSQVWDDLADIQDELQFGYDPESDFSFYLNEFNEVSVSINEWLAS